MDRRVVEALRALPERNRFMKGLYAWVGFRTEVLPYTPLPRHAGTSSFSLRRLAALAFTGITAFTNAPLRMWSGVGAVVALIALGFGLWIVGEHFIVGHDVPGWATLVAGLMFSAASNCCRSASSASTSAASSTRSSSAPSTSSAKSMAAALATLPAPRPWATRRWPHDPRADALRRRLRPVDRRRRRPSTSWRGAAG